MELSNYQYKVMKYLRNHDPVSPNDMTSLKRFWHKSRLIPVVDYLVEKGLAERCIPKSETPKEYISTKYNDPVFRVRLTENGYATLEDKMRKRKDLYRQTIITVIVSAIVSFAVTYLSCIASCVSSLVSK